MKKLISIILLIITLTSYSQWSANFQGIDSIWNSSGSNPTIWSLNEINNTLYLGGAFEYINNILVNYISKYDGQQCYNLNSGAYWGGVYCTEYYHNNIFAGGDFDEIGGIPNTEKIAMWDGVNWVSIDEDIQMWINTVYDMTIYNDTLFIAYILGNFKGIVSYEGNNWIDEGNMNINHTRALTVYNNKLYVGGDFGLRVREGLATWEEAHGGVSGPIMDMEVDTFNNFLYVGGAFYTVGEDDLFSAIASMWDGFNWTSLGGYTLNCDIYENAMAVYRGDLYVGGCIDTLENGLAARGIARWDGQEWHSLESGVIYDIITYSNLAGVVFALEEFRDTLIVGGNFKNVVNGTGVNADTLRTYGLAKWFMPDTSCNYIKPRVQSYTDTFNVNQTAQLYNNNAYADTWSWDFGDTGTSNIKDPSHVFTQTGTYTVNVTVTHGTCSVTAEKDIVVVLGAGIEELVNKEQGFTLYPNPTKSNLQLVINNEQLINTELVILNIDGKIVKQFKIRNSKFIIQVADLEKGTYFVKIGEEVQRFVKN